MIRVNLLPVKERKRAKRPAAGGARIPEIPVAWVAVGAAFVLVLVAVAYLHHQSHLQQVANLQEQIRDVEDKIEQLKVDIRKVNEAKKKKEQLQRKIDIIKNLKAGQTGPVRLLDELSQSTPPDVWLTDMSEDGARIQMTGVALDSERIAEFMRNLNNSEIFHSVELTQVTAQPKAGYPQPLKGFQLSCNIRYTGVSR
jgi:type IV pilus assembly protein PilN